MIDILKVLGGALFGASLALFSAWLMRQTQREADNAASGNVAVVQLGLMINGYANYRMTAMERYAANIKAQPDAAPWICMHPISHQFNESLRLDLKSLSFLFGVRTVGVLNDLIAAEMTYHSLIALHKAHYESMTALQTEFAKLDLELKKTGKLPDGKKKAEVVFDDLVPYLPAQLVNRVQTINLALHEAFETDEYKLHDATEALYRALCTALGKPNVRRFVIPDAMAPNRPAREVEA